MAASTAVDNAAITQGRVIVTYGRSLMSLVIAQSLGQRGVEVIGCDDVELTVMAFSRFVSKTFVHAKLKNDPHAFLDDLERHIRAHAPDDDRPYVLMPVFRETAIIAAHRDRFAPLIQIAAPSAESIAKVHPKDRLVDTALSADVLIPETRIARSVQDLSAIAENDTPPFPVLTKPADGVGGRGIATFADRDAFTRFAQADTQDLAATLLVQEMVDGDDYCVPILCRDGEILAHMAYRNLGTFPRKAGAGALRETIDSAPFLQRAQTLMAHTGWTGVAELDYRWTGRPDDPPHLIEVNARFWAGLFHSMESGVDFPWLLYQLTTTGGAADDGDIAVGQRTRTPGVWLLSAIEEVAASDALFASAEQAWAEAGAKLREGALWGALVKAGQAGVSAATLQDTLAAWEAQLAESKDAPSEFSYADDPLTGLGVLFVAASLLRHGRLPPELTHKPEAAGPPARVRHNRRRVRRPIIGITKPVEGEGLAFAALRLAVWLAGGRSLKLTARDPVDGSLVDGLIFGGGADVLPERYQQPKQPGVLYDPERDHMEAQWAELALEEDLPALGVCRGAQMMNVSAGGTLRGDLHKRFPDAHYPTNNWARIFYRKAVRIEKGSRLHDVLGVDTTRVNSIHTQTMETIGVNLSVAARETNGVVQAIEHDEHAFYLGVQFHPEFLVHRALFRGIFTALVEAAAKRAAKVDAPL